MFIRKILKFSWRIAAVRDRFRFFFCNGRRYYVRIGSTLGRRVCSNVTYRVPGISPDKFPSTCPEQPVFATALVRPPLVISATRKRLRSPWGFVNDGTDRESVIIPLKLEYLVSCRPAIIATPTLTPWIFRLYYIILDAKRPLSV